MVEIDGSYWPSRSLLGDSWIGEATAYAKLMLEEPSRAGDLNDLNEQGLFESDRLIIC